MQTLQEFLAYTKGWEYIIIVIFFVGGFMGFWRLLKGENDPEERRTREKTSAEVEDAETQSEPLA